ncbi:MAG: MauE/DoxX family redox-associated membrane protein [Ferruginibacter sp.]
MIKMILRYVMATFYFFAGINHFIKPEMYKKMIPPFFQFHSLINYAAGFIEIAVAILLLVPKTRRFAGNAIILLLILFLPVHFYMLQTGWCPGTNCLPEWVLWVRLILLQPLLVWMAWWVSRERSSVR